MTEGMNEGVTEQIMEAAMKDGYEHAENGGDIDDNPYNYWFLADWWEAGYKEYHLSNPPGKVKISGGEEKEDPNGPTSHPRTDNDAACDCGCDEFVRKVPRRDKVLEAPEEALAEDIDELLGRAVERLSLSIGNLVIRVADIELKVKEHEAQIKAMGDGCVSVDPIISGDCQGE